MSKKNRTYFAICLFSMMILFSISDNVIGALIPTFKSEFSLNNTQISSLIAISSLGYIIFGYIGGIICSKYGYKILTIFGYSLLTLAFFMGTRVHSYVSLIIVFFIINSGIGTLTILESTVIPIVFISMQAVIMNLTHFFYGLGSSFSQKITGTLIAKGTDWRSIYLYLALFCTFSFIMTLFAKFPTVSISKSKDNVSKSEIFKNKLIYLYIIAIGTYVAAETNTGKWLINYIMNNFNGFTEANSSNYTFIFFAVFSVGRLLGGFVVEKFGYFKTVIKSMIAAFLLFTAGILLKEKGLFLISLSGLFFSIVYPTVVLTINSVFKKNTAYITGIIIPLASVVTMIIGFLFGYMNDKLGTYITFFMIPLCILISLTSISVLNKKVQKTND
ncbi:MAG TPA: MFS transporter [Clostridiaceae bacterium]|nr:MFS transporter [Clostridiaceae bacterium]